MSKKLDRTGWIAKRRTGAQVSVLAAVALSAPLAGSLVAQQITGAITGAVTDPQGGLLPNATVTATNSDTGQTRTVTTNASGNYLLQYLPVGHYSLSVEAAGFQRFVQQNLVVQVDQTIALPVSLALGAATQTVTVTDAPPLVETTTATLGRTISPAEINTLPLVNRNAYTELSLTPGVQSNSASSSNNTPNFVIGVPSTQVVINGGSDGGTPMVSFYLDGGINMTGIRNYGNPLPNPDALEEFRVETNNFAAQYGRMGGGVVTAVTRSGTNAIHGTVFEFLRNDRLNATNWGQTTKARFHRNQFGATVGGPIVHDKAFFFFSYGGLRQTVGQSLTGAVLPSALERVGDFTQSAVKPFLPGTTTLAAGTNSSANCRTPTVGCLPSNLLDKTAANILSQFVPLPNGPGNTYNGYFTGPTTQDEYLAKVDGNFRARDHFFVSYFLLNTQQDAYGGGNIPYSVNRSQARQQVINISDVHTFTDRTVNQTWLTVTRVAGGRVNLPATSLGDLGSTYTIQGPPGLPQLIVAGYFSAGGALAGPVSNTNFYSLRDVVSLTRGNHAIDLGGEASLEKDAIIGSLFNFGVFNFATSAPTTTRNALADFVTGQVNNMEQDTPYHGLLSNFYFAGFAQDNWKVTPRLTLNLGLRYDVQEAPVESQNQTATFIPGRASSVIPTAPLGLLFPGDTGVPRGIVPNQYGHISPRAGIALDVFGDGKTALRAGGGMFFGSVSGNEWNQPANAQPFAVRQTFASITSLSNVYANPASFPNGDPFPYNYNPQSPRFLPAASVETISPTYKWPVSYQFNTAMEQQLPGGLSLQVAYVGNLIRHIAFGTDDNAPLYAAGANTTQTSINARRPFDPGVLGQNVYIESNQNSSYHSMQVSARKQMTKHLLLNGFYVWSHTLWSAQPTGYGIASAQDFSALYEERGRSDNDRRNVGSLSGVWNLSYYGGNSLLRRNLVNGWEISTIVSLQSGAPFNITTGSDRNLDGYNNDRPNLVPSQIPYLATHRSRQAAASAWFNTAAFVANGPGVAGGIGPGGADGNTPRDFLSAPGYRDIDLGLSRKFLFTRGLGLEVRADATNAFNNVSLNAPNSTLSSSQFGRITGAASPRLLQLGARFTF